MVEMQRSVSELTTKRLLLPLCNFGPFPTKGKIYDGEDIISICLPPWWPLGSGDDLRRRLHGKVPLDRCACFFLENQLKNTFSRIALWQDFQGWLLDTWLSHPELPVTHKEMIFTMFIPMSFSCNVRRPCRCGGKCREGYVRIGYDQ